MCLETINETSYQCIVAINTTFWNSNLPKVSQAKITPSLYFTPITEEPVTYGYLRNKTNFQLGRGHSTLVFVHHADSHLIHLPSHPSFCDPCSTSLNPTITPTNSRNTALPIHRPPFTNIHWWIQLLTIGHQSFHSMKLWSHTSTTMPQIYANQVKSLQHIHI